MIQVSPPVRAAVGLAVLAGVLSSSWAWAGTAATRRERERALRVVTTPAASLDRAHEAYLSGRDEEVERLTRGLSRPPDPDLLYLRALSLEALGRPEESRQAFEELERISDLPEHRAPRPPAAAPTHVVHVGTFSDQQNAERLSARLAETDWPAYVELVSGERLWRVYAGPFVDESSALQAERALRTEGHPARVKRHE